MSSEDLSTSSGRSVSSREDPSLEESEDDEGSYEKEEDGVAVAQPPRESSHGTQHDPGLNVGSALEILDQVIT